MAELVFEPNRFVLKELKGKSNRDAPERLKKAIIEQLEQINVASMSPGSRRIEGLTCAL